MLQRYSHIRTNAKVAAIAALEQEATDVEALSSVRVESLNFKGPGDSEEQGIEVGEAQNRAQPTSDRLN